MQLIVFMGLAVMTGAIVALQNVLNASLGRYVGSLGAVLVVAAVGFVIILAIVLLVPKSVDFRSLPGPGRWYLYLGGLFGITIVGLPVFLVPRVGATVTITGIVVGQLAMAVLADQFGVFGTPQISASLPRMLGVLLLGAGAYLVARG